MKNKIKLGLVPAVLLLALLGMTACSGGQGGVSQQFVKVARGDLTVSVTGSGTVKSAREARLLFGSSGKVDVILVKEGNEVKEGDVLARLDTSALELARVQAEAALMQAQLAQRTAERSLETTRDSENTLELALLSAQISQELAERALDTGIAAADYQAAKAQLNKAKIWYNYVLNDWPRNSTSEVDDYDLVLDRAREQLDTAQARYDNLLAGYDSQEIAIKRKQVEAAELSVAQAQKNLDDLPESIAIQELQVASANQTVAQAAQALDEAQRQLDETSIVAPFDGMVAQVLAKEGDIVPSPSMAPQAVIYLVTPGSLELVVEVDEIDIPLVETGQTAVIEVDALPGTEFEGVVTAVYPVPKEVGGVVLYEVRLAFDVSGNAGVKVGMSASADILMEQHSDVLMVPSRAVTKNAAGETVVKVMSGEQVQERTVVVGIDDGLRAEIISGLQEGETVVVEVKATSSEMSMFG
jgi:RND family efflux transporter MFP subunit